MAGERAVIGLPWAAWYLLVLSIFVNLALGISLAFGIGHNFSVEKQKLDAIYGMCKR